MIDLTSFFELYCHIDPLLYSVCGFVITGAIRLYLQGMSSEGLERTFRSDIYEKLIHQPPTFK